MPSRISVMLTASSVAPRARTTSRSRSWVIGPGRPHALLLERDRGGLDRADPDRQVPLPLRLLEQQDRLVARAARPGRRRLEAPARCGSLSCWPGGSGGGSDQAAGAGGWAIGSSDGVPPTPFTVRRSQGRSRSRRRASSSAVCSCADSAASSRSFSVARVRASSERARSTGATSCSTSPASRSTPVR